MLRLIAVTGIDTSPLFLLLVLVRAKPAWTSPCELKSHLPYSLVLGFIILQIRFLFSVKLLMEVVFI